MECLKCSIIEKKNCILHPTSFQREIHVVCLQDKKDPPGNNTSGGDWRKTSVPYFPNFANLKIQNLKDNYSIQIQENIDLTEFVFLLCSLRCFQR